jgi:hypothetical protein
MSLHQILVNFRVCKMGVFSTTRGLCLNKRWLCALVGMDWRFCSVVTVLAKHLPICASFCLLSTQGGYLLSEQDLGRAVAPTRFRSHAYSFCGIEACCIVTLPVVNRSCRTGTWWAHCVIKVSLCFILFGYVQRYLGTWPLYHFQWNSMEPGWILTNSSSNS